MRIAKVEPFRLYPVAIKEAWVDDEYVWPSHPPSFLVRVTAESGETGVGEITSQQWYLGETADQIAELIGLYDQALQGAEAGNIAMCHFLMEEAFGGGMPGARGARSGVDMAIYDLVGKARGVPAYELMGGGYRTEFELLTNLYHKTPEAMAEGCREFVANGFKGLKIKVGDVMNAEGWSRDTLISELALLEAALEATPRDVYIDADTNQGWKSANWTITALRRFAQYDNLSIEQPVMLADLRGAVQVRKHAGVPLILDESVWSPEAMLNIARMEACDRIVLKLTRLGGFFECLKVISICESANIGVSVDSCPFSLLGDTACCHIAAAIRDPYPVECETHVTFITFGPEPMFSGGITFRDGLAHLPDAPGLGVDVDWDAVAAHQMRGAAELAAAGG